MLPHQVGIAVGIANTRGPDSIEALQKELAGDVTPLALQDATKAEVVILEIPFARTRRWLARAHSRPTRSWSTP